MDVTEVAADLEEVNRSAVEASKLLAEVRDLAGIVGPEYVVANANTTLARLLEAMSTDLDRARIQAGVDLDPKLPVFRFDPRLLALAVSELVRNVQDALPSGGQLHVRSSAQAPRTAMITVSDNCPGVGDLMIDELTTPFFTTRKGHLGMGLTVCKTCVEVQGGKLTLDPGADERGACFVIQLPSS